MGIWGPKMYEDDLAQDIKENYKTLLQKGKTNEETISEILSSYKEEIKDIDEGPVFWMVFADTLWDYGRLTDEIKEKAIQEIELGNNLNKWKKEGTLKEYKIRERELEKLKEKLNMPMTKEKKICKESRYKFEGQPGDVYIYKLSEEANKLSFNNENLLLILDEIKVENDIERLIFRVKITKEKSVEQNEKFINSLEYIQTSYTEWNDRFLPLQMNKSMEQIMEDRRKLNCQVDENGVLKIYLIEIEIKKKIKKLEYIGNYLNIEKPKYEFIPIDKINIPYTNLKYMEKDIINAYISNNLKIKMK